MSEFIGTDAVLSAVLGIVNGLGFFSITKDFLIGTTAGMAVFGIFLIISWMDCAFKVRTS